MCFSLHGKMSKKNSKEKFCFTVEWKFAANICYVYAKTMLLLFFRICMETAQNSENSSPKLLFDNKLRANLVWKYASTFDLIVNHCQEPSIQKQIACRLWRLSIGNTYRDVGRSALSHCERVLKTFRKRFNFFVKFPKTRMKVALEIQKF